VLPRRALAAAARGLILALLCINPAWAANPLVGNWSSTVDWDNQAAGLYQVMSISAGGQIHILQQVKRRRLGIPAMGFEMIP
jgi:hypothetical protein